MSPAPADTAGAPPFRRIGVIAQRGYDELAPALAQLATAVEAIGAELAPEEWLHDLLPGTPRFQPSDVDLLVTFGGDGTLLRGARLVAPFHTPVLGVNLGYLGFLTSVGPGELERALERLFGGDYVRDARFTLAACVRHADGRDGPPFLALNDAVLHKGGLARVVKMRVLIGPDGEEVARFSADGLILATPTGSTAYSLSAMGPVVVPSVECIIATPICPHTLGLRPLVLPPDAEIVVEPLSSADDLILTVDGRDGARVEPHDRLVVRRGTGTVQLVRFPGQSFFVTLRRKLHWGSTPKGRTQDDDPRADTALDA